MPTANSMQHERGTVAAIATSSLVLALCLWLVLDQLVYEPKRCGRRRSSTPRSRPSSRPSPYLSVRTAILAQANTIFVHAVLVITTASLNLLSNPIVSAARMTSIGLNQTIYGILSWELYLVVHPYQPQPFFRHLVHLFIVLVFILPYLAPWAALAINGMGEKDSLALKVDDASGMLTLLVIVIVALAVTARILFIASLGTMLVCRISELRGSTHREILRPRLLALHTASTTSTSSSVSLPPSPPLSSTPSSSSPLSPEAEEQRRTLLLCCFKILIYLVCGAVLNILGIIPLGGKAPESTNVQVSLVIQLILCLLIYFCFDRDASLVPCLPPSLLLFLRRCLRDSRARAHEGEEEEEEEEEEGGREGGRTRSAFGGKKRQHHRGRGEEEQDDEKGEEEDENEEEEKDERKEESHHAAAAAEAAAAEDAEIDGVLRSPSPRTLSLAYAVSSGAMITDSGSYGEGGAGIGRGDTSGSEGSWEYDRLQRTLFESEVEMERLRGEKKEGVDEGEDEEGIDSKGGGGGGGGGGLGSGGSGGGGGREGGEMGSHE